MSLPGIFHLASLIFPLVTAFFKAKGIVYFHRQSLFRYLFYIKNYLATLSSHFTILSITIMERPQATTNTNQVVHIGVFI